MYSSLLELLLVYAKLAKKLATCPGFRTGALLFVLYLRSPPMKCVVIFYAKTIFLCIKSKANESKTESDRQTFKVKI